MTLNMGKYEDHIDERLSRSEHKLEYLVRKAISNGWCDYRGLEAIEFAKASANTVTLEGWVEFVDDGHADETQTEIDYHYTELIYNHKFAKALFGGNAQCTECGDVLGDGEYLNDTNDHYHDIDGGPITHAWQYHLQQAVISKDPIGYLYSAEMT